MPWNLLALSILLCLSLLLAYYSPQKAIADRALTQLEICAPLTRSMTRGLRCRSQKAAQRKRSKSKSQATILIGEGGWKLKVDAMQLVVLVCLKYTGDQRPNNFAGILAPIEGSAGTMKGR